VINLRGEIPSRAQKKPHIRVFSSEKGAYREDDPNLLTRTGVFRRANVDRLYINGRPATLCSITFSKKLIEDKYSISDPDRGAGKYRQGGSLPFGFTTGGVREFVIVPSEHYFSEAKRAQQYVDNLHGHSAVDERVRLQKELNSWLLPKSESELSFFRHNETLGVLYKNSIDRRDMSQYREAVIDALKKAREREEYNESLLPKRSDVERVASKEPKKDHSKLERELKDKFQTRTVTGDELKRDMEKKQREIRSYLSGRDKKGPFRGR
jgi:hypothetical protein